jgi:hypothetical protein
VRYQSDASRTNQATDAVAIDTHPHPNDDMQSLILYKREVVSPDFFLTTHSVSRGIGMLPALNGKNPSPQ